MSWRLAALGGLVAGLAAAPLAPLAELALLLPAGLGLLGTALVRPAAGAGRRGWEGVIVLCCALLGLGLGAARLRAIDAGAMIASPGSNATVRGYVAAVPRRSDGLVRVPLASARGRLLVEAPEPVPALAVGAEVRISATVRAPPAWYEAFLRRQGIARVLRTARIVPTGARRGGLVGRLDLLRTRAERALGRGMPPREAALARGFVLGQDDGIDPGTAEDFRRAGLAHLLAVSGQNVVLLAILAWPLLALFGLGLRARLLWTLVLIAIYVPVAGAGPSIQRAGAMGAAGVVATLAGRPASRIYALLLAGAATLALNPRAGGDVGWQLSFAAVIGIVLWAAPLRKLACRRLGSGAWQRALADGASMTASATMATAPLLAHHFGAISVTSLAANLVALPAVAPAMWLGMGAAAMGQVPGLPVEALNLPNSVLLAYVAEIAAWFGAPGWAAPSMQLGTEGIALAYLVLGAGGELLRRRAAADPAPARTLRPRVVLVGLTCIAAALGAWGLMGGTSLQGALDRPLKPGPGELIVSVLDVGQGDAILLQPAAAPAVLVDGGPAGDGLEALLRERGVTALGAAILTHDQSDHSGALGELLGQIPVGRLGYATAGAKLLATASATGVRPVRLSEGAELRSGRLLLEALWPPRELLSLPRGEDPNRRSLVLLARWGRFEMLLTGDAEAAEAPLAPGPVEVLKVAHHGSEDPGLEALLERAAPRLAVLSVGVDNPYGHPAPTTLQGLAEHGVRVLRTDRNGTITIRVEGRRFSAWTDGVGH